MVHDYAYEMIDSQTNRASIQILFTLMGGVFLVCGAIAWFVFADYFYSQTLGMFAAILLGTPLVYNAAVNLFRGKNNLDLLAALAVIAAFATGQYLEAGAVAFFLLLAVLIESRTALGARKTIESLVRITPTRARLIDQDHEREVDAKDLKPGDIVRVLPGDNIPGDGHVISGRSTVNQATITGESLPVDKNNGDDVFGGTINVTGEMRIQIDKAGEDTTLGRVKDLILQAEQGQIPVMRLVDKYASWYTPTILMLAAIVFFFTEDKADGANRAIGMLVLACPCSIVLATPTAMVAALSAAARLGVLIKNVTDLEVARKLTAVVFDKTGTLTTGELSVTRIKPAEGVDPAHLLAMAAAVEQSSRHPVARAVMAVAEKAKLQPTAADQFEEVAGRGVQAQVDGKLVSVGRGSWLGDSGMNTQAVAADDAEGMSLLYVSEDDRLLGWIGLEDRTRPDAARAMDDLRELGLKKLVMITGDRWSVAQRVAGEMHCTDVQAEVLPGQKLELVDELKARGHTVAVVGDGVNDAPALAAGDISVAMGAAGSDVAIHSASVALMNNNLNRIPFLLQLSRKTMSVVRQNILFSIAYIVIFEALAATGYIHPIAAVLLHMVSSFVVVFNSARLVREGEDVEAEDPPTPQQPRRSTTAQPVPVTAQTVPA